VTAPRRRPLPWAIAVLAAALVLFSGPRKPALAAPFATSGEDWEGLSQLVRLARAELGAQRVILGSPLPLSELKREDGVIIVHPTRALDADELSMFMHAGGRVVLLDDYGTGDGLLAHFGIRRVPMPARPAEMLRGNPSLALAEPASGHSVVRDVGRVVTNHATGLDHPALSPVLVVRGDGEPDVLLGIGGAVGRGRLVAIGDASIPINAMMRYPGNRALALGLVRFATEDDVWGVRSGKLYVLCNDFETTGSFGDDSPVTSAAADSRRMLLDALETLRQGRMPPVAAYLAALAIGLGVVVWTSLRAGKTHRQVTPRFVRPVPVVAQGGIAGHAAVIGAPGTSRVLAMLELKSALEEELAMRLGIDRPLPYEELVAKVRATGLLDDNNLRALSQLLATLGRVESMLLVRQRSAFERVRDAEVISLAERIHRLVDAMGPVRP